MSVANSILKKPKQNFRRKSEENESKKTSMLSTEKVKIFFLVFYYFQYFKYFRRLGDRIKYGVEEAKKGEFGVKKGEFGVKKGEFGVKKGVVL